MDIGHIIKWKGYFDVWRNSPRWQDGVWVINPFSLIPLRDMAPFRSYTAAKAAYRFCLPSIRKLLQKSGQGEPDIIWASKPGSSVLKSLFPKAKLVMQVVDYYPAFRGDYIKEIEKWDYKLADHIFLIGHAMMPYLTGELGVPRGKITVLGQGVSIEHYEKPLEMPLEYQNIKGPRAVWVGVLEKCDTGLFREAAEQLSNMGGSLVLIGGKAEWARKLSHETSNVFLLGPKQPQEVPAYLQHADIGLMLYDRKKTDVYRGQNPLKLYEYAAAGLSILSTPHEEYRYLKPPVLVVSHEDEIGDALSKSLENIRTFKQESLAFASRHAWESVYQAARKQIVNKCEF